MIIIDSVLRIFVKLDKVFDLVADFMRICFGRVICAL